MIDLVEAEPLRNAIAFALVAAGIALPACAASGLKAAQRVHEGA